MSTRDGGAALYEEKGSKHQDQSGVGRRATSAARSTQGRSLRAGAFPL